MGNISARLTRQFYRFNAENRAQKILKSKEIRPAPKYDKTLEQIDMLKKEMPSLQEDLSKFDDKLHDRLKQVYVTSSDVTPAANTFTKPPPLSHKVRRTSDFGFDDGETAAPGHITLKDVVQMIMTYSKEDNCKIEDLANTYKLKPADVANILKYYQCFTMQLRRGKMDTDKYLNTILFGNETGEILLAEQFIKRIETQKGVRDSLTKGIPPLNEDIIAWQEEEMKRALASGDRRKRIESNTKQAKSEDTGSKK